MRLYALLCSLILITPAAYAMPDIRPNVVSKMVPHKALYDISLRSVYSSAQIANISGKMYYEWKPMCDAWVSSHRFTLLYEYADSPAMIVTSDFTTYETMDGTSFSYASKRERDGQLYQVIRGQAENGQAVMTSPEGLTFDLPKETFFPVAHTVALLDKAWSGEKFFNSIIFDGSDEEGPVEVNAVISGDKDISGMTFADNVDTSLLESPAKSVRLAFFPLESDMPNADYEMSISLHDNGVISDMDIEYSDFSLRQRLVALERIKPVTCGEPAPQDKDHAS